MQDKMIEKLEKEIRAVKEELGAIGAMRPGAIGRQYHRRKTKEGPFWQLSYTYQQCSHSEHIRDNELEIVQAEVEEYRRFKELCAHWVDLALQRAKRQREIRRSSE